MNNYFRRKKAFLFCALLLFFVFIFCYEPPDTPAELRHLKDSLSWSNLTFEDYHLRREIYEDLRLLGPGGDPVERSMIIEEGGGARGLQTRIINALYTYYRGNAMPNNPLDNKQNYVIPRKTMICDALRNVNISIYKQGDPNFKKEFSNLFPSEPFLGGKRYQTCALVSNSGAVIGSGQGKFIDNHELVVRFNHAITDGYEKDVGSKTDLRILNSLLLKDNKYDFLNPEKTIYHSEKTIYIAFEKSERNMSFKSWSSAAYNYLDNYARKRRLHRNQKFYLLDYNSLWNMQDWLGSISKYPIANYIPSSGFIGLHLILRSCDVIRLFEFIPSQRDTDLCHYFERYSKPGCGYRGDHSFAAEKLAYYIMGNVAREEIFEGGYLTIDTQHC